MSMTMTETHRAAQESALSAFNKVLAIIETEHDCTPIREGKSCARVGWIRMTWDTDGLCPYIAIDAKHNHFSYNRRGGSTKGYHRFERMLDSKVRKIARAFIAEVEHQRKRDAALARQEERSKADRAIVETLGADAILSCYNGNLYLKVDSMRVTLEQAKRLVEVFVELGIPMSKPKPVETENEENVTETEES